MLIPPRYRLTTKISELLSSIEASKAVIDAVTIPTEIELNIRRQSTLKSSLYSARIEGSPLTLDEVENASAKDKNKLEIFNILKGLNWIKDKERKNITQKDLLTLHQITMKGLIDEENLGKFRKNMEAIFNSAGIAIYMPPPPRLIETNLERLFKYLTSEKESFVPIKAAMAHYSFEKIHPFLDGSGRVGRLLIQLVLNFYGYGMKGLLSLEEYLENHRAEYYRMLEEPEKDVTDYLEFMLEAVANSAENAKNIVLARQQDFLPEELLLPRRTEMVRLIREQKIINFDSIKRRFMNVNARTLRYDLKKLQEAGFIQKLGTTRGVYYTLNKNK